MSSSDFQYELFFELSPDLFCIAGFDGYFKKVNNSVSEVLGYTMEELYSRPINDFVYHEDKEITARVRKELTEEKTLLNFENRYVTKKGDIVWLSWTSLPVPSDKLVFAIAKNITHKKQLEADRNKIVANLTNVNKFLKELNYSTSHDLRSPVNNLISLFSMIDVDKVKDSQTLEIITILKQAGEKLKRSLDEHLDVLTQKHEGYSHLYDISLERVLQKVLSSISLLIKAANCTINVDFSKQPTIRANEGWLESVFLNLITNSIKYSMPGRAPVISIVSETDEIGSKIIVSDNGMGFDIQRHKHDIFGFRKGTMAHPDSKGIGLYLVHHHVTSMGGTIKVESTINEGTTFIIGFGK